ncbi:unnamed protein product [Arabidopsis thaliana]|uniref:(thale cress) hypothetical protein n=1 Tax=Arabidopsis thaliana TaxID=3702 RepID=A0A7G2DXS4_ARATH|nr:unnamed protein product [Arabidopsis thaliana]
MALGREQKKVTPPLDEWLKRGKDLNPAVLRGLINSLCESQRFNHALQVSEWITKRGIFDLSTEDFASRLCLVEISTGLKEAEKFFKSIPENMRDDSVHTTLLSLYTISKKTRHEAEATYQTMRVQNMLLKPYPYYSMIYLYALLGEKNMIDEILRQMKENGVEHDKNLTANNVLKAYASLPDVEAMEMFLMGLEVEEPRFSLAWQTGISIAKAYLKGGSSRKAVEMLRRTELVVDTKSKDSANKVLMMMYWDAGAKQDASRLSRLIYPKSVSLAVGPRTDVDKTASSSEKGRWSGMTAIGGGSGGLMGSLRVIELQLVAFILVFSASGLVPILDMLFPAFASIYIIALSRLAFPSHGVSTASPEVFRGSKLFRLYVISGTTIGLFLPLAYVLGGFARGDDHAVRSATPHLFLLSCQILTENVISGLSLFSPPVRALVPLLYTVWRIFVIIGWSKDVWFNKSLPINATPNVVTWFWFGRYLALANLGYFGVNLLCFLIPRFLPRAFEQYFRERDEILAKSQEDKPVQVPRSKPSNHKSD